MAHKVTLFPPLGIESLDDIVITASDGDIKLEPTAGSEILLDDTIHVDAGVITGATSITSTAFVGALTGNADTATNATTATVADTTDTSCYVGLWESATGNLGAKSDATITYNAGTGALSTGSLNTATITSGEDIALDATGDIELNADGDNIDFKFGSVTKGAIGVNGWNIGGSDSHTYRTVTAISSGGLTNQGLGIGVNAAHRSLDIRGGMRLKGGASYTLTGSIDPAASTAVVGVGTQFLGELLSGDHITVSGETRTVTAIADNTNLTVDEAFSDNANDTSVDALPFIFKAKNQSGNSFMTFDYDGRFYLGSSNNPVPVNIFQLGISGEDGKDGMQIVRMDDTTADGDILGGIGFDSEDGNVPSRVTESSAYIAAYAAEDHSATDKGGDLAFGTTLINDNDDVTSHERMRILDSGNVGIGTSAPDSLLHILASGDSLGAVDLLHLSIESTTAEGSASLKFSDGGDPVNQHYKVTYQEGGSNALKFHSDDVDNVLFLETAGNVGVRTALPSANFQVAQPTAGIGTVTITSTTTCTGTGTEFLNTFKVGDNIILTTNSETRAITAIASDTVMTIASATNVSGSAYTLAGGDRFSVLGNGNVGIGTTAPTSALHVNGSISGDYTPSLSVITDCAITPVPGTEYVVNDAGGGAMALPDAYQGARIKIVIGTTLTSDMTITSKSGDVLKGYAIMLNPISAPKYFAPNPFGPDLIITMNGSTQGGIAGTEIEFLGISTTEWRVRARMETSGSAIDPFS